MTPQQQARLGEIAVWVGTAQELLAQAYTAAYEYDMLTVLTIDMRTEIARASIMTTVAARKLLPQIQEVVNE